MVHMARTHTVVPRIQYGCDYGQIALQRKQIQTSLFIFKCGESHAQAHVTDTNFLKDNENNMPVKKMRDAHVRHENRACMLYFELAPMTCKSRSSSDCIDKCSIVRTSQFVACVPLFFVFNQMVGSERRTSIPNPNPYTVLMRTLTLEMSAIGLGLLSMVLNVHCSVHFKNICCKTKT